MLTSSHSHRATFFCSFCFALVALPSRTLHPPRSFARLRRILPSSVHHGPLSFRGFTVFVFFCLSVSSHRFREGNLCRFELTKHSECTVRRRWTKMIYLLARPSSLFSFCKCRMLSSMDSTYTVLCHRPLHCKQVISDL